MNTDDLRFLESGILADRTFERPARFFLINSLNNEFYRNGKIYCWTGNDAKDQHLVRIDEASLGVEKKTDFQGYCVSYVDDSALLFECGDKEALLIDPHTMNVVNQRVAVPKDFTVRFKLDKNSLFYFAVSSLGVFRWPSVENLWEMDSGGLIIRSIVVHEGFLYCVHLRGVSKLELRTGEIVWQKSAQESWRTLPVFQSPRFGKALFTRTEQTAVVGDTLVVFFDPKVIAGIDIHTGDIQWTIDTVGPHKLRVTPDGIGWYFRNDAIHRLDIKNGMLLPPVSVQFGPALEKTGSSRIGGFDMSTTHIIAESTVETKSGKNGYILGINRESGIVDWAVPIEGMVTKLFLLNNRVYATGMMVSLDNPKPTAKTLVIEGEGGYIPD